VKLNLLEDGVLDYKGDGLTLATPNAVPNGSLKGAGVKPAPTTRRSSVDRLKEHLSDCPVCSTGKLCKFGERLTDSI
jgi:hypothetical protein